RRIGKDVCVHFCDPVPELYRSLPGAVDVCPHIPERDFDVAFVLDIGDVSRAGKVFCDFKRAGSTINLDHHLNCGQFGNINLIDSTAAATGILVYRIVREYGYSFDLDTALCIYIAIITDTGSLSYACNNPSTYRIISRLIAMGIDGEDIHRKVYDTYSEDRMRLLGYCLSERLRILDKYATSYIYLTKEDLKKFSYKHGDTEGFVNYGLSIKKINFTAIFVEREDRIRISFRSMNDFNVNEYARKYFKGGGHKNAAGADSFLSMEETLKYFEQSLKECKVHK
ncbi:MAG TPA: DHHA1 domain-containing protein, partial [Bacteroidales bacterium]|nr:DHHA1 domain-containing protein [Bacteroidales bacterium]